MLRRTIKPKRNLSRAITLAKSTHRTLLTQSPSPKILAGKKQRSPALSMRQPRRAYINSVETKGTHRVLRRAYKHLSPLNGLAFRELGALERLYEMPDSSASCNLVRELWHKHGQQFRSTQHKSKLGYSLMPRLLAKIIYHLNADTFDLPATRTEICAEWQAIHITMTSANNKNPTKKKFEEINTFLDMISQSKKECLSKYPLHMTEHILLGFLCFKAEKRPHLTEEYFSELRKLSDFMDANQLLVHNDEFSQEDINQGMEALDKIHSAQNSTKTIQQYYPGCDSHAPQSRALYIEIMFEKEYENILASLIINNDLPKVIASRYGYNNHSHRANCVETGFHNLCNILLFNKKTNQFDFAKLPATLHPSEKLKEFYANQNYTTNKINDPQVGQAFMELVSGKSDLHYMQKEKYELNATAGNFIPLINHLFGSATSSLEELSQQFSD